MAGQDHNASGLRRPRGRPPLKKGQAKRSSFNTRLRTQVKERLEAEASSVGRSLSEEIEFRLERSLIECDWHEQERKRTFGPEFTYRWVALAATVINLVEDRTGKKWTEDHLTYSEVGDGIRALMELFKPKLDTRHESVLSTIYLTFIGREIVEKMGNIIREESSRAKDKVRGE